MDLEYIRVCKHRPNDDCTHYQEGYSGGDLYYLMLDNQKWFSWSGVDWEEVEGWLADFLIDNPTPIDTSIRKERKYNWDNVPENIKYIATSEDGFAFGYEWKPLRGYLHRGFWYGGGESTLILWPYENQFNSTNWRHSLERRDD